MENSTQDICDYLEGHHRLSESYVLIREIKTFVETGSHFSPEVGIKIWKSNVLSGHPYHYELSHHVHTPTQAGPYYPSRTAAETETQAIDMAIDAFTSFLVSAIQAGHQPSEAWLVPNEDY
ncbi:hypothetical protein [Pseudomonas knackmussii]|uniref:hypothetical protein n=1 Tax=Pseudomonas knackmussii TaxID=65741 RepID=UPI001363BE03|nr:hypothetical protein [Pseudomonas knackmussii]